MLDLDALQANPSPARSLRLRVAVPQRGDAAIETAKQQAAIQSVVTGGHPVPTDRDWTAATAVAGSGLIEWRCITGTVQFRGFLKHSITNGGSHTTVRQFPKDCEAYHPPIEMNFPVYAIDTGVTYRIGLVRITPAGVILASAPTGKFDGVDFGGIEYKAF